DDEIVCGFGRTGNWFGKETVGMAPDMMALAKGLSSSYFPISAVVVAPKIYEAVREFNKEGGSFGHGFTNSGHPVGVAVALETLKIYEEMDVVEHVRRRGGPGGGADAGDRDRRGQGNAASLRARPPRRAHLRSDRLRERTRRALH